MENARKGRPPAFENREGEATRKIKYVSNGAPPAENSSVEDRC